MHCITASLPHGNVFVSITKTSRWTARREMSNKGSNKHQTQSRGNVHFLNVESDGENTAKYTRTWLDCDRTELTTQGH
jgi:hypothetical protein